MAANPRDSLWTLNWHLPIETLWSPKGVCVWTWMCTCTDLSLLTYFTPTHIHPWNSQQLWPAVPDPLFVDPSFSDEKKNQRNEAARECFWGDWGWVKKKRRGKQGAEGDVRGSHTGFLYRFGANRCFLVQLVWWLALLIEQVTSVIGWLHIISEVLAARSYWDISLIAF